MTTGETLHQTPARGCTHPEQVKPAADVHGGEVGPSRHGSEGLGRQGLMERVLMRENLQAALQRVKRNAGSAGVDGMTVAELPDYLREHWPRLREELRSGKYRPSSVRRHSIPKPGGGERELGIPTVLDRFIQQALLQVLQPLIDPTFSGASYGFRPGRRAQDAVKRAQGYVQAGYRVVVDVDLEKFFDRVNHDILMDRLRRHVNDGKVLRLVRSYLNAGIMVQGVVNERYEGTPQGGPLSPLLANVLLDEVDRELERSGHRFVRYADDCNVYVRSQRAGERVLVRLRQCYARLRLRVNEAKSAVARATQRTFLGFAFWNWRGEIRRAISSKALARYKERVRRLTRRTRGRSIEQVAQDLRDYVPGWKGYFHLAQTPKVLRELDEWLRHRLRALHLKQWRHGSTMYRELRALGAKDWQARNVAANGRCWWRNSAKSLNGVLTLAYFDRLGVPRLS